VTTPIYFNGKFYGTTELGGSANDGVIYSINPSSWTETVLHSFSGTDGKDPLNDLLFSNGKIYGTTYVGGTGFGTIFSMNIDGSDYQLLHQFSGSDGSDPESNLILYDGQLFGTTTDFGSSGYGELFSINLDGSGFQVLQPFTDGLSPSGDFPAGDLTLVGNTIYGTAITGGVNADGTLWAYELPPVPEPPSLALLAIGGLALSTAAVRRRRNSRTC
jgi:uncharacterized repeat protein (TIGR03803 family)